MWLQCERDPTQLSLVSSCNVTVFKVYIKPFTFGVNVSSTKKALPFVILNMTFPALCMQFLKYKLHFFQFSPFLFSAFSSIFCLFYVFLLLNIQYSFVKYIRKPAVNTGHRLFDKIKLNEIKGAQSSGNTLLQNGCC